MITFGNELSRLPTLKPAVVKPPRKPGQSRKKVWCLTCGKSGVYTPIGPNHRPAWICTDALCDSYVGCHPGTENALGHLAGPALRAARMNLHVWVDLLWRGKESPTRKEVYQVLSQVAGVKSFHVAESDLQMLMNIDFRRLEVERILKPALDAPTRSSPAQAAICVTQKHAQRTDLAAQVDQSLKNALFGTARRRLWPTDSGGQIAAARCLQLGTAHSYLDSAGRRWISLTSVQS